MIPSIFSIILFFVSGITPSIIWLVFYLKRDVYPEPKEMIMKVFALGMIVTFLVAFLEIAVFNYFQRLNLSYFTLIMIQFFLSIAFIEECAKYLVVRIGISRNSEFDEPIDAMIYMVVAGLGFAAVENILVLFPLSVPDIFETTLKISFLRGISATVLHALAAANIGYFWAYSLYHRKYRFFILIFGIVFSSFLHGIYNLGINMDGDYKIAITFLVLSLFFLMAMVQFQNIRKLKSVCKI